MLRNPTVDALHRMHLTGMAAGFEAQRADPNCRELVFEDRFGLLVDAEWAARENRRLSRLLKRAKLKIAGACVEDIDYASHRGLDRKQISALTNCEWVERGQHLLITGPTGVGKTWLGCAFGNLAARKGHAVIYRRLPRLLEELEIAHADGSLPKLRTSFAKARLLILDDWGVAPLTNRGQQDLLEIIDDRVPGASVLITAQMPVDAWHEYLGEPTIADAILDRILHSSHKIALKGDSMRKIKK